MKLRFTYKEYQDFDNYLSSNGYKKYNGFLHNEDFYFAKTLHRTELDENGETRSDCQLFFSVYDFSKYPRFEGPHYWSVQVTVNVSRNKDERIELLLMNENVKTVSEYEEVALKFFSFINSVLPE